MVIYLYKMRRKLIKQKTAYTITLPIDWVREHGIDKTGELDIVEEGNTLILSSEGKNKPQEASLTLVSSDKEYCRIMIENHYLKGYDILNVYFSDNNLMPIIQNVVSNLIGIEIVKQSKNSCMISQTAMPTTEEFKSLFNRCTSILTYTLQIVEESIKNNIYDRLEEISQLTKDARRFLLFLTRTIHKHSIIAREDESFMHLLLERFILIQHNQLYMYQKLAALCTRFVDKKIEKVFLKAQESFLTFIKQLHKQDISNFSKISKDWTDTYFNHKLFVGCSEEESVILYHSMYLAKQVFLISQPNLTEQFKYII